MRKYVKRVKLEPEEIRARRDDRFAEDSETGRIKLTSYGCNQRYDLTRDEMHLTNWENMRRDFAIWNNAEREERDIQNKLVKLIQRGFKFLDNESVEEFIVRCQEV